MRKAYEGTPGAAGIAFSYEATPTPTSKFEVTVNDVLVHSKIGDNDLTPAGFPDSEAKLVSCKVC